MPTPARGYKSSGTIISSSARRPDGVDSGATPGTSFQRCLRYFMPPVRSLCPAVKGARAPVWRRSGLRTGGWRSTFASGGLAWSAIGVCKGTSRVSVSIHSSLRFIKTRGRPSCWLSPRSLAGDPTRSSEGPKLLHPQRGKGVSSTVTVLSSLVLYYMCM